MSDVDVIKVAQLAEPQQATTFSAHESEQWNHWAQQNARVVLDELDPVFGAVDKCFEAMECRNAEHEQQIKELCNRVAKLERELEQVRADNVVLPRSAWKSNAA